MTEPWDIRAARAVLKRASVLLRPAYDRVCPQCAQPFVGHTLRATFCSKACHKRWYDQQPAHITRRRVLETAARRRAGILPRWPLGFPGLGRSAIVTVRTPPQLQPCAHCGQRCRTIHQTYCSRRCRTRARERRLGTRYARLDPVRKEARRAYARAYSVRRNAERSAHWRVPRPCDRCALLFVPERSHARHCSKRCMRRMQKRRLAQRRHRAQPSP